jgi:ribosomal protein S18 acetylase RimI-like enzyme
MYLFQKAHPGQSDAIYALYREATVTGNVNGTSDWSDEYPTKDILDDDLRLQRLFILQENDELIAAVSLLETDDLDGEPVGWKNLKSCVPVRLCVSPDHQGKRIGERVMDCLIEYVKPLGLQSMRLLAAVNNHAANHLYRRMGFAFLGEVHLYEKNFNAYELVF